ncbi:MAG: GNAT family N-acetyltransferase [Chloroflexota bacterium]
MNYRVLDSIRDFEDAFALEVAVWGLDPRDAVPVNMLRALQHAGGAEIGAYNGDQIVGFTLGFPAKIESRMILWSHMTGVHRDYQGKNIGFELKRQQREWALANGFDEIRWTFDPLQRGNANFNIHRLGATAENYLVDFYGAMVDEINQANIPTDRVEGVWRLRDPRVVQLMNTTSSDAVSPDRPFLLRDGGLPETLPFDTTVPEYLVQIPSSLSRLPSSGALLKWRMALRKTLAHAFAQGYAAVDFTSANAYLLRHL